MVEGAVDTENPVCAAKQNRLDGPIVPNFLAERAKILFIVSNRDSYRFHDLSAEVF